MLKQNKRTYLLYDYQLRKDDKIPINAEQKWETIFKISKLNWKCIYTLPFKTPIDTKLQEFQYKYIIALYLPINIYLNVN